MSIYLFNRGFVLSRFSMTGLFYGAERVRGIVFGGLGHITVSPKTKWQKIGPTSKQLFSPNEDINLDLSSPR